MRQNKPLELFEQFLLSENYPPITNIVIDQQCVEYNGFDFTIEKTNVKFRTAKLTPKKIGGFVTLWRRDHFKQTIPYSIDDNFDVCIIFVEKKDRIGFFCFPKEVLKLNNILSNDNKQGKRGFRVYAFWDIPQSKQAINTKDWQNKHFIELGSLQSNAIEKFHSLFK